MKVLVYGTLMKGYRNHEFIANQKFLGIGELDGYEMYHVSSFPGIVKGDSKIIGEVYEIDSGTLQRLDQLEAEGYMYKRETEKIMLGESSIEAFVYIWNLGIRPGVNKVLQMPWTPLRGINYG